MNALTKALSSVSSSLPVLVLGSLIGCAAPPAEATDGSGSQALSSPAEPISGKLPAGTYKGTGSYVDPADASASGPYRSAYEITANKVTVHWSYGPENTPSEESVTMNLHWTSPDELTFGVDNGNSGGRGYCLEDRCHFSAVNGDVVWFDMTMTFGPHGLTTLGSKHVGAHDVYWSETLEKL